MSTHPHEAADSDVRFGRLATESRRAFAASEALVPAGTPGGLGQSFPHTVFATRAEGCYVWDADDRQLIDLMNGDWLLPTGHATPQIIAAITDQLSRGTTFAIPDSRLGGEMAARLRDRIPSMERIRFCCSGTEATMFAMRVARAATGRGSIAKIEGGYHGTNDVAMIGNGHHREASTVPAGLLPHAEDHVVLLPYNNPDRAARIIVEHAAELAAVIVEPMLGAAGMVPSTPEFLRRLREVTAAHDILLIFDEIVTFTLGHGGAQGWFGVTPDLTTLGKAIGGGLPLAAFGGRADVMDLVDPYRHEQLPPVRHGSTTGGIPVCLAAGIAALDLLDDAAYARLHALGEKFRAKVREVAAATSAPLQVTGLGHFFGLHWSSEPVAEFHPHGRAQVRHIVLGLYNEGFLMFTNGAGVASLPMTSEHASAFGGALRRSVDGVLSRA